MRANLIVAVSALGLLAGPAFAQTSSPPAGGVTAPRTTAPGAPTGGPAPVALPRVPAPDPLSLEDTSQIKGSIVYGSDDKKIGSVSTVLMKPDSKTLDRLVVSEGGVLGIGSHRVALPIDDFKWDRDRDAFKVSETAAELKAMPAWNAASADIATAPSSGSSQSPLSTAPSGGLSAPGKAESPSGSDSTAE
jgi:hypothetical protein